MTVIFQFSSLLAFRKPDITMTHPAINPKIMIRLSPFFSGPTKLSKDPVPSAKATGADQLIAKIKIKPFCQLPRTANGWEDDLSFIENIFIICIWIRQDQITFI